MERTPLKLAAALLAFSSLALDWFRAGGAGVRVFDVYPLFLAPFYAGLAIAVVAVVKGERYASLAAACTLSTSPAYAYFALKLVRPAPYSLAPGSLLCLLSAALFAADWLRGLRGGPSTAPAAEE